MGLWRIVTTLSEIKVVTTLPTATPLQNEIHMSDRLKTLGKRPHAFAMLVRQSTRQSTLRKWCMAAVSVRVERFVAGIWSRISGASDRGMCIVSATVDFQNELRASEVDDVRRLMTDEGFCFNFQRIRAKRWHYDVRWDRAERGLAARMRIRMTHACNESGSSSRTSSDDTESESSEMMASDEEDLYTPSPEPEI